MTSRVARLPINLPKGVEATVNQEWLTVKGGKGALKHALPQCIALQIENSEILVTITKEGPNANALAGTTRALVHNMVKGVSDGFERKLVLVGVGYRAAAQGKTLSLSLGFSHPVNFAVPEGITIETPTPTEIVIKGANKQVVGQVAANIRAIRPPEPYKGKGVRYSDEVIILKETKKK